MKKTLLFTVILGIFLVPALAFGASLTGTIQGFNCVTQGKVCPVGKEDPMAATEKVFVLWDAKGEKFYFVPNVDRAALARHINETVKIEGNMSDKYNSIKASEIHVKEGKKWRKVWSSDWQDEIYKEYLGGSPYSGK
ncbi:MAG: hypothetical protein JXC33_09640 [Deltaproteobacteria bacterium]|nr:hypothetical protein [Deltaproteobacteria bacterium]